mmetsp:Transcript_36056/g.44114  ORF Transcript_36056/g.44114 Transcript_36056/m.44114 type:complete len:284 (-) Transcript_36056:273-1124(-)
MLSCCFLTCSAISSAFLRSISASLTINSKSRILESFAAFSSISSSILSALLKCVWRRVANSSCSDSISIKCCSRVSQSSSLVSLVILSASLRSLSVSLRMDSNSCILKSFAVLSSSRSLILSDSLECTSRRFISSFLRVSISIRRCCRVCPDISSAFLWSVADSSERDPNSSILEPSIPFSSISLSIFWSLLTSDLRKVITSSCKDFISTKCCCLISFSCLATRFFISSTFVRAFSASLRIDSITNILESCWAFSSRSFSINLSFSSEAEDGILLPSPAFGAM